MFSDESNISVQFDIISSGLYFQNMNRRLPYCFLALFLNMDW